MKKTVYSVLCLILLCPALSLAENYTLKGEMGANIRYELQEQVTAGEGIKKMVLSFVKPRTFESPTYRQEIKDFKLVFSPEPQERKTHTDSRGNEIVTATWTKPADFINVPHLTGSVSACEDRSGNKRLSQVNGTGAVR
jgi:hypothetical protein